MSKLNNKRLIKILGIAAAVLIILLLLAFAGYSIAFSKKIYANQFVAGINLGGKDREESFKILKQAGEEYLKEPISLKSSDNEKVYAVDPTAIGLNFDIEKTVNTVWSTGRNGSATTVLWQQLKSLFVRKDHTFTFEINDDGVAKKLQEISVELDQPEQDFSITYKDDNFILLTERKEGRRIDQAEITGVIKKNIANLKRDQIIFAAKQYRPQVSRKNAEARLAEANLMIAPGDLVLKSETNEFHVDSDTIGGFVKSKVSGDDLILEFVDSRIILFVQTVAKSIDADPVNAKLTIVDGKVSVFQTSQIGKKLDQSQTVIDIQNALRARSNGSLTGNAPINLKIALNNPDLREDQVSSLGINELVGTATTDFKKSPVNRVHNITVGANALNGILIKPNETFSTLSHLGAIDASGGYLEELVIKEDKTVPEFGGGLCQVSSTLFRAALNSGMKITERQNHKYRVSYYEPPVGMDATIYDPSPDFKFINNYASHILVQSKIEKTKITFEFYGTKDNRKVEISDPALFDIVDPGAAVEIQTDTLAPGERKQIEKAHPGASASFNYKVTSAANEVLQEKTFKSKYVPWPEKWLVGKTPDAVPAATPPPAPAQ